MTLKAYRLIVRMKLHELQQLPRLGRRFIAHPQYGPMIVDVRELRRCA